MIGRMMSTVKQVRNWWYITCPACGRQWGWFGTVTDMPLCGYCANRPADDDIERLNQRLNVMRGVELINEPSFQDADKAYEAIAAETDIVVLDRAFSETSADWRCKAIKKRLEQLQNEQNPLLDEGDEPEEEGSDDGESNED